MFNLLTEFSPKTTMKTPKKQSFFVCILNRVFFPAAALHYSEARPSGHSNEGPKESEEIEKAS